MQRHFFFALALSFLASSVSALTWAATTFLDSSPAFSTLALVIASLTSDAFFSSDCNCWEDITFFVLDNLLSKAFGGDFVISFCISTLITVATTASFSAFSFAFFCFIRKCFFLSCLCLYSYLSSLIFFLLIDRFPVGCCFFLFSF